MIAMGFYIAMGFCLFFVVVGVSIFLLLGIGALFNACETETSATYTGPVPQQEPRDYTNFWIGFGVSVVLTAIGLLLS